MHEIGVFSITDMRDFIPEKLRPWIIVLFVMIFQCSGGIYLAVVSEMVGELALKQEDILMAGYASMVGMGLVFPIAFRLKFRFPLKNALLTCAAGLIICNLISMHTGSVPVLVATCFVSGFFRMWGTFECNSTIQLWITPKRDLSIFFCYVYLLVHGFIQISGLVTIYTSIWASWEYMHWLVIALLGTMMLTVVFILRSYRSMRKLPLFGIDWLGGFMWGLTILCIIFVCIYGDYFDWYYSSYIRMATIAGVTLLLLNLWRASFIRHPYIANVTWSFPAVYLTFVLFVVIDILLAPSHLFEHIYLEGIVNYDELHVISLNWISIAAVIVGSAFTYFTFAKRKWRYKTMTVIAFVSITAYLMWFYFMIDYNLPKQSFILPVFLRSFGYVIIAICFLTALSRVPFQHFFGGVCLQNFVSAGFGGVLGTAVLSHVLKVTMKKNVMLLGATLDNVNPLIQQIPLRQLYGSLQQHALLVSMKEIYGWLVLASLLCLLLFLMKESTLRPKYVIHPRYRLIRRYIKHELRMRKKMREQVVT